MPSQNKLIKQGLKYTDSLFDEINKRLEQGVKASDTLEAFLDKYHKAFPDKGNPLISLGYDSGMLDLILQETNNHKFSRPSQKELVRVTIENQVGELISNVGDDIRESVRDIVKDGYDNNLSQDEIAANISNRVSAIKGRRARAIARTEIARTATISDYVINAERGATHFYVECRNTACPVCKEAWHKHWSKSNDESFQPKEKTAGGKGWIGDKVYSMSDTMMLPPIHPNCRCVPYFISEDDIPDGISVEKPTPKPTTTTTEPTREQLQTNLTKEEREQYHWAKGVLENEFIKEAGKQIAREKLEVLRQKALGETAKPKSAPKPVEPVKTKPTPVEQKPTGKSIESMTSQELYESMTKADKKKYDNFKKKVETADKNIKQLGENPILLDMKKKNLMELRKLEQKQRTKLENKGKRKPKQKSVRTNERTLDNIYKEVEVPTNELIPQLEKWIDKRCKNVAEFGYHFDINTGEIIGGLKDGEIRGMKGRIAMKDLGEETGSIHSHPRNGMSAPSIDDLETFRCKKQQHHFMVSEHEIWYVKATDNFGIGGMGQQLDLQSAHKACRDRAFETVSKLVKKGEIEATEEALAKALDKYTGDEILKTFNKPPWNKTMIVKRYYR